jgi:hypothetical protein
MLYLEEIATQRQREIMTASLEVMNCHHKEDSWLEP